MKVRRQPRLRRQPGFFRRFFLLQWSWGLVWTVDVELVEIDVIFIFLDLLLIWLAGAVSRDVIVARPTF